MLSPHLELHVLELDRWSRSPSAVSAALAGWMRFFTEGERWHEVPPEISTPILESAMTVLTEFQKNAAKNDLYRRRLDYQRVHDTVVNALENAKADVQEAESRADAERTAKEQALAAKEQERAAKEQALAAKEQALASNEHLRARLRSLGVDPDGE